MYKTLVKLPDGRMLSSGDVGEDAILKYTLTQAVNDGPELNPGSVCASVLELTVLAKTQKCPVTTGDLLTVYRQDEVGSTHQVGVFVAEKPTQKSPMLYTVTAYDRVCLLDQELSRWLEGLQDWPYSLQTFAKMVCTVCNLELEEQTLPNGAYSVEKFSLQSCTGRQLMRWIGALCGRFCVATPEGKLRFGWYQPTDRRVGAGGGVLKTAYTDGALSLYIQGLSVSAEENELSIEGPVQLTVNEQAEGLLTEGRWQYYYQGGFTCEDYRVCPVERVQLKATSKDVGTVYPADGAEGNAYVIESNPLLQAHNAQSLIGLAQTLYEQMKTVTYTPGRLQLPGDCTIQVGDILTVTDGKGQHHTFYVMKRTQSARGDILECTGSRRRDSITAVNHQSYQVLGGKVLELQTTVDGLQAENRDQAGKSAALSLQVEGITAAVSRQQTELGALKTQNTQLEQTADSIKLQIRAMRDEGVDRVQTQTGFTFDEQGLTISKSGTQMENLLNEEGMYVRRSGEIILQADKEGVTAVDVTVGNYLVIGGHSRLEDYTDAGVSRTACFWI